MHDAPGHGRGAGPFPTGGTFTPAHPSGARSALGFELELRSGCVSREGQ